MAPVSFQKLQSLIGEARRNPEQNPKVSINERIRRHLENADMLRDANVPNSFVSFTAVDKLGINPGSRYDTPLGIYCYPSFYVYDEIGDSVPMSELPFVGDAEFANVFSVQGTILNLNTISSGGLSKLYERISEVYIRRMGIRKKTEEWKEAVDYLEMEIFDAAPYYARFKSNGGLLWWVTKEIANIFSKDSDPRKEFFDKDFKKFKAAGRHAVVWNQIFREIGIDGCVDGNGEGIIHTSEKTQAVFFSKKAVKENNRYYNKYAPDQVADSELHGEIEKERKAEEKKKFDYLKNKVNELKGSSDQEMLDFIRMNRQSFTPIAERMGKNVVNAVDSPQFKKQLIINNIETHHFVNDPSNYFYIRDNIAPSLSESDVAEIANSEVLNLHTDQLHFVINLKKNMDLSLIDDRKFRSFKYEYESISDVDDMNKELTLGSVYSRNVDFVIKMIEISEYKGRGLGQFVEGVVNYNEGLSSGKLFELFDAYVGKLRDNDIPYDILTGDLVSMALGSVSTPDFKSVKAQLDDKYGGD